MPFPAALTLVPPHLREELKVYLAKAVKFDYVPLRYAFDIRSGNYSLQQFCSRFGLNVKPNQGYLKVSKSTPDAAVQILRWCLAEVHAGNFQVRTPWSLRQQEPTLKRHATDAASRPSSDRTSHSDGEHEPLSTETKRARQDTATVSSPAAGDLGSAATPPSSVATAMLYDRNKPRAFANELHERGGGGSCWINAVLQALFAPLAMKAALARMWSTLPLEQRTMQQQKVKNHRPRFGHEDPGPRLLDLPPLPADNYTLEERVAIAFGCAHSGDIVKPFMPCIITDHYYRLHTEDAGEFLQMHLLQEERCPTLAGLATSHGQSILTCAACHQPRDPTAERFCTFEAPIEISGSDRTETVRYTDVQSAFNAFLSNDYNDFPNPCEHCERTHWVKSLHTVAFPQVLVLTLKRFKSVQVEPGRYAQRCVGHPVATTEVLDFQGHLYDLRSVVVHLGDSIEFGHYIALARHDTNTGTWWLYNDAERKEATREQVATTVGFRHYAVMKSYVLFYEKRPVNNEA